MGAAQPKLSFIFLAEDVIGVKDSLVGEWGHLGVEKRVRVSFIRAEAAT